MLNLFYRGCRCSPIYIGDRHRFLSRTRNLSPGVDEDVDDASPVKRVRGVRTIEAVLCNPRICKCRGLRIPKFLGMLAVRFRRSGCPNLPTAFHSFYVCIKLSPLPLGCWMRAIRWPLSGKRRLQAQRVGSFKAERCVVNLKMLGRGIVNFERRFQQSELQGCMFALLKSPCQLYSIVTFAIGLP